MVQIQINIPKKLSKYLEIKKPILNAKDKRDTIIKILEKNLSEDPEIKKMIENANK